MTIGVHATHCCLEHGCKYGDDDCPVVLKKVKQDYPCEWCKEKSTKQKYWDFRYLLYRETFSQVQAKEMADNDVALAILDGGIHEES